jgi:hypothetical protein
VKSDREARTGRPHPKDRNEVEDRAKCEIKECKVEPCVLSIARLRADSSGLKGSTAHPANRGTSLKSRRTFAASPRRPKACQRQGWKPEGRRRRSRLRSREPALGNAGRNHYEYCDMYLWSRIRLWRLGTRDGITLVMPWFGLLSGDAEASQLAPHQVPWQVSRPSRCWRYRRSVQAH